MDHGASGNGRLSYIASIRATIRPTCLSLNRPMSCGVPGMSPATSVVAATVAMKREWRWSCRRKHLDNWFTGSRRLALEVTLTRRCVEPLAALVGGHLVIQLTQDGAEGGWQRLDHWPKASGMVLRRPPLGMACKVSSARVAG